MLIKAVGNSFGQAILGRRDQLADLWLPRYRAKMIAILNSTARAYAEMIRSGSTPRINEEVLQAKFTEIKTPEVYRMITLEYNISAQDVGLDVGKKAIEMDVETAFNDEAYLQERLSTDVDDWIDKTSKQESKTTAKRYQETLRKAAIEAKTPAQMAQMFLKDQLTSNKARAEMMARTATIWSFNEGAMIRYTQAGVQKMEWVVAADDVTCEFCLQMGLNDNKTTNVGQAFTNAGDFTGIEGGTISIPWNLEHPPLHPNCRCCLVPVLTNLNVPVAQVVTPKPIPIPKPIPKPLPKPKPKPVIEPKPILEPTPVQIEKPIIEPPKVIDKETLIVKEEIAIRNELIENAIAFDDSGAVLFKNKGTLDKVSFSAKDIKKMKNGTLTHNHPDLIMRAGRRAVSSFSAEDITTMSITQLNEIRAVTSKGTLVLKRTVTATDDSIRRFANAYKRTAKSRVTALQEKLKSEGFAGGFEDMAEKITQELFDVDNAYLKTTAKKYGLEMKVL